VLASREDAAVRRRHHRGRDQPRHHRIQRPEPTGGRRAERLRQAGIEVITGVEEAAARALNAPFFHVHDKGPPFVALKLAMSVDGGIAEAPGVQTTLTGPAARAAMHRLRAGYDAIMVGIGTALTDDPQLTVRDAPVRTPPVRVVADTQARLPLDGKLVTTARETPVWLLCASDAPVQRITALEQAGVRVIRVPRSGEHIDMRRAMEILASQGVNTIFAEGGAAVTRSLLETGSVHRIYIFLAPLFLGPGLLPAFGTLRPEQERWQATSTEWLGSDVLVTMDLPPKES
jgi:diaminohydroxyphosphoribosylaminopyrimidine deaminase / 5-amino-6-(5-phosphoribosylamino)uracil reductase